MELYGLDGVNASSACHEGQGLGPGFHHGGKERTLLTRLHSNTTGEEGLKELPSPTLWWDNFYSRTNPHKEERPVQRPLIPNQPRTARGHGGSLFGPLSPYGQRSNRSHGCGEGEATPQATPFPKVPKAQTPCDALLAS